MERPKKVVSNPPEEAFGLQKLSKLRSFSLPMVKIKTEEKK